MIVLKKLEPHCLESVLKRAFPLIGAAEKDRAQLPPKGTEMYALSVCVCVHVCVYVCVLSHQLYQIFKFLPPPPHPSNLEVAVTQEAISVLSELCDGDARRALNALQIAVQSKRTKMVMTRSTVTVDTTIAALSVSAKNSASAVMETLAPLDCQATPSNADQYVVTAKDAKESLQHGHLLYDRAGEEHYNCISALHKSMRGSDSNASLYWLARMLDAGEDPLYVARRVVRFASEDIGLLPSPWDVDPVI